MAVMLHKTLDLAAVIIHHPLSPRSQNPYSNETPAISESLRPTPVHHLVLWPLIIIEDAVEGAIQPVCDPVILMNTLKHKRANVGTYVVECTVCLGKVQN